MKFLSIPFVPEENYAHEKLPQHVIGHEPWNLEQNLSCTAAFSISHFDEGINLKFSVTEPFLRVKKRKINGEVHRDNCVEFFIAFDQESYYYNFEFNCLGSVKAAYGKNRLHRKFLPAELLKGIENNMAICMDNLSGGKAIRWEISIVLPVTVFHYHHKKTLSGEECSVNFAKCGDSLPKPHFLSWVEILSDKPDFHQPQFFGRVKFESNPVLTLA
ncbi:carbohydrate-binding family 9-like protein [Mucilaginibacter sabulilitoris]|uniref:Carbohydrate-binding family 9-like protein n=1 Tax=Mucilaginibacter sabulilitoris TaxID=1173583 RepID=A0ABZ0TW43_9SPHI|nr:carbohydrate-binding family 9-like protein [Mucilaginibacter sabulilitoris]WPU96368.1 carbohydrate-binding family 9-like protein [Mucilaginibacter sabulilitoris]